MILFVTLLIRISVCFVCACGLIGVRMVDHAREGRTDVFCVPYPFLQQYDTSMAGENNG